MISRAVSTVRGTAPIRTGKAHGRQSIRACSASSSDKSDASGEASSSTPSDATVDSTPVEKPKEVWKEPFSMAQIFGTYVQLGVWVLVLGVAGFTGFQKAQTNPDDVGMLLAPPGAALFLMGSFALYRVLTNEKNE